jgi:hypothetical protein
VSGNDIVVYTGLGEMKELARESEEKEGTIEEVVLRPNAIVVPFDEELKLEDRKVKVGRRRRYI